MKIKELEEMLSVSRSNIRFYEKEGLLNPIRKENNYRNYSEQDITELKKILILRKLGFSVEEISAMQKGELSLPDAASQNIDRLEMEITNQDFLVQEAGNINSNIELSMNYDGYENTNLNLMNEIQTSGDREEQDYGLILYIVKKGDTLWEIAKRFGSTIDDIVRTNGIEDANVIAPGQKLYIPRYVKIGI